MSWQENLTADYCSLDHVFDRYVSESQESRPLNVLEGMGAISSLSFEEYTTFMLEIFRPQVLHWMPLRHLVAPELLSVLACLKPGDSLLSFYALILARQRPDLVRSQ